MSDHPHFTPEQMVVAIVKARGLISHAAKLVPCHPETVREYAKLHPGIQQALYEARELQKDDAESKLLGLIDNSDLGAVKYYLGTQAKDRGYVERTETRLSGDASAPVVVDHRTNADAVRAAEDAYLATTSPEPPRD